MWKDHKITPCTVIRILESGKLLLLESALCETVLVESGFLGFGTRYSAVGIRNPGKTIGIWSPSSTE